MLREEPIACLWHGLIWATKVILWCKYREIQAAFAPSVHCVVISNLCLLSSCVFVLFLLGRHPWKSQMMNLQYVNTPQGNGLGGCWTFSCGYPKLLLLYLSTISEVIEKLCQPWNHYHQTCLLAWKLQGGEQPKDTQKGSGISDSKTSAVSPSGFSLLLLICSKAWQITDTGSPPPCVVREPPCRRSMAKTPSDHPRGLFYVLWEWVALGSLCPVRGNCSQANLHTQAPLVHLCWDFTAERHLGEMQQAGKQETFCRAEITLKIVICKWFDLPISMSRSCNVSVTGKGSGMEEDREEKGMGTTDLWTSLGIGLPVLDFLLSMMHCGPLWSHMNAEDASALFKRKCSYLFTKKGNLCHLGVPLH